MRLNLALLALLQQALCAPHPDDPADLHSALHSDRLDAWIGNIAAKQQLSKHAVRSMVQATTHHLDPDHPAGGEHARLERRQPLKPYPNLYQAESHNDLVTRFRVGDYNGRCRRANGQPPGSPFTPSNNVFSFWRAVAGGCKDDKTVQIQCRLPREFAPSGWDEEASVNTHLMTYTCPASAQCTFFRAHNFAEGPSASWGGCTSLRTTDEARNLNGMTKHIWSYMCPMGPASTRRWYIYGETTDGKDVHWRVTTGRDDDGGLAEASGPTFMFANLVTWQGTRLEDQPWMKFERYDNTATVRLFSVVV